jgi:hypothetical protein
MKTEQWNPLQNLKIGREEYGRDRGGEFDQSTLYVYVSLTPWGPFVQFICVQFKELERKYTVLWILINWFLDF